MGDTTIKIINEYAKKNNCSLEIASRKLIEENKIKPKTKISLNSLLNFLKKWRNDLKNNSNHNKLLQIILDESGYSEMLKNKKDLENENRLENIKELLNAMKEFDNLESFLEHVALATSLDQNWQNEKVNLMTMHSSKVWNLMLFFYQAGKRGCFLIKKALKKKEKMDWKKKEDWHMLGLPEQKKQQVFHFQ